jgi:hypothetical protein
LVLCWLGPACVGLGDECPWLFVVNALLSANPPTTSKTTTSRAAPATARYRLIPRGSVRWRPIDGIDGE